MRRFYTIIALLLVSVQFSHAQVTLEQCREMAMQNHPSIKMYGIIDATKDFSVSNASRQWLPSIRVGALAGLINNVPTLDDIFSGGKDPDMKALVDGMKSGLGWNDPANYLYKAEAELSQNIYDGGASKTSRKIAEAQAELQRAETDVTQDQVRSRVDEIYFSILLLEKRILQVKSKIAVLCSAENRTEQNLLAGKVRQSEMDAICAAEIEAQQQLITLESTEESFRKALSLLVGVDMSSQELSVPSRPAQFRPEPMYIMLDKKLEMLSLEKKQLDVTCRPTLNLVADAYYGYPNRIVLQDLLGVNPRLNAFVGVKLSWNISSFYTRKNNLGIISNSLAKINLQKEILDKDIQIQNSSVNSELTRLQRCMEKDNQLVVLRSSIRENAELSYASGTIDAHELVSVVEEEFQARLNAQIHEIESLHESFKLRR